MIENKKPGNVLARLFAAMETRGELPSLQSPSDRVVATVNTEEAYLADLTTLILADLSLSQKVIRQANSAMRRSFGDEIISITRAIQVLGVQNVERFSAELPDIKDFQAESTHVEGGRAALKRAMIAAEFARSMTHRHSGQASEEAVLSTLMHLLAPTVLALYLEDDWEEVLNFTRANPATSLRDACREVLGISLTDVAAALAKHFNVPEQLADCMEATLPIPGRRTESHTQWLSMIATMSAEVASMVETKQPTADITRFVSPFLGALGMDGPTLDKALDQANAVSGKVDRGNRGSAADDSAIFEMPANPMERLGGALAQVRSIAPTLNSAGVIPLVVENIGQCLNLRSGFLLLLNTKDNVYAGKVAYGDGVRDLLPVLRFDVGFVEDIFHHALSIRGPSFFPDVQADGFGHRIPDWYKSHFPSARSLVLVPIYLKERCIALFCGTWGAYPTSRALLYGEIQNVKALADEISLSVERSFKR